MSFRQKVVLTITILISTLLQVLPVIRSGLTYPYGIGFWGPMGHDGIWHLALINQITNPLTIPIPCLSGQLLQNYHPFFDIVIAFSSYLTHLPTNIWLFQIAPIVISLVFLSLSFILGYRLTRSFLGGITLVFLNTFSNSFGWLVNLFRGQGLGGESLFWSMQPPSFQINPPFALSMIFIYSLILFLPIATKRLVPILCLLVILPLTKSYGGVTAFLLFGWFALYQLCHRQIKPMVLLGLSFFLAIIFFRIYNPHAQQLFEFKPFALVNSMIDSPDRFYLPRISSFRQNVSILHPFDLRVVLVIVFSVFVFIVGNYAWRIIALIDISRYFRHPLLGPIILTIFLLTSLPILFVQKATAWNAIQFLYYAIFLSNILLTDFLVCRRSWLITKVLMMIIFTTSLISNLPFYQNYLGNPPPAALPTGELQALQFLEKQPPGIILTYPYDPEVKKSYSHTPIPLYAYETSAYVAAYSHQLTFLEDLMNLNNSGYDWASRLQSVTDFFGQRSVFADRGFLLNNQIDYIYLTRSQANKYPLHTQELSLSLIFENDSATIYQVKR